MTKQKESSEALAFEPALAELEALVEKMEQGDIGLQESLQLFERGIALARSCQQALREAETKIQVLMEEHGKNVLTDLPGDDNGSQA